MATHMATRDVVVGAVRELVKYDPRQEFTLKELIQLLATTHPHLKANAIRMCIARRLCTNATTGETASVERLRPGHYRLIGDHLRPS